MGDGHIRNRQQEHSLPLPVSIYISFSTLIVSTKGRYALRVMIDLAAHNDGSFVPLAEIAERQGISEKYLESILVVLSRAGFLQSLRGKGGGYRLSRAPEEYTADEIVCLAEGTLAPVTCMKDGESCERAGQCPTRPMWEGLDRVITEYLSRWTVADLLKNAQEMQP